MLTHIHIKDFALIDEVSIDLASGFTILTGETGAGKSIIIDALELTLGARAETSVIRHGAERCEITLSFSLKHLPEAKQWLTENELTADDECIIRRIINQDGRSRSLINGSVSPLQSVRELGALLINIHGQHEHQQLLKRDHQRIILDQYANNLELCANVQKTYQTWRKTQQKLNQIKTAMNDRQARSELLRFHLVELNELALQPGEVTELEQENKKMTHSEQLMSRTQQALQLLSENDEGNIVNLLYEVQQQLAFIKAIDPQVNNIDALLNEASIQIQEATDQLQSYANQADLDQDRFNWITKRLDTIYQLARKHRVPAAELVELSQNFTNELAQLTNADEQLETLQQQIAEYEKNYRRLAEQLSQRRQQAAQKLATAISAKIQQLGLQGGKLSVTLTPLNAEECNAHGLERIEFMVSANAGQPLQPLNKVASGGELSRIGLAIQVIIAQQENTPTLIFDEVDVGIGGGVAEVVGQLLRKLGKTAQVLCITHLPQVAAQGHQHWQVKKQTAKGLTQSQIQILSKDERVDEIARMLGGVKITASTLAHAREMLGLETAEVN